MAAPHVLVITHAGKSTRFELADGKTATVGRTAECDVVVDDRMISRRHAAFHAHGGTVEVEDLGSHNGTLLLAQDADGHAETMSMVAQHRLQRGARAVMAPDAMVQIGGALVTLELPGRQRPATGTGNVVSDPAMTRLYELAARVAVSELAVLLLGESGAGKEVLARFIHRRSLRSSREMVSLNCGAIAEQLIEAELFGSEKGAFTGATKTTKGLLETADKSTVFLDEVGELSPGFQVKLLRVLETGTLMRVGGREPISVDVRYIAATNRDLSAEIASGRFREDLFYRLNGISLTILPLRERPNEIVPLAMRFAREESKRRGLSPFAFAPDAIAALTRYSWPGNVRQLKNVVRRATVLCTGTTITAAHLQMTEASRPDVADAQDRNQQTPSSTAERTAISPEQLRDQAEELEKQRILEALEACAGNQTRTAEMLGLTRRALVVRLNKYDLPRPRKGRDK